MQHAAFVDPETGAPTTPVRVPADQPPTLLVVVDTEEEFDWEADFDRNATSVEAMRHVHLGQEVFDEAGVQPAYLVDFPVASQATGFAPIKEFVDSGRAVVGAHLHPWVSPPFDEEVNRRHSFAGNLSAALERAKLERLIDQIEDSFGERPVIYKAGRYGIGPNTAGILEDLGFEVDLSACPAFDFSAEGGPDYSRFSSDPYWFGEKRSLLGLPATGAFVGRLQRRAHRWHHWATRPRLRWARLPGILARLGLIDRLHLSPEGFDFSDLRRLTKFLLARGVRVFTLSFHSPTLDPGRTPYARDRAELKNFLDVLRSYL
ncbi:MAG: polysaccharide deacetylase family protein, partial [Thermoanaerobaculia bacterium]